MLFLSSAGRSHSAAHAMPLAAQPAWVSNRLLLACCGRTACAPTYLPSAAGLQRGLHVCFVIYWDCVSAARTACISDYLQFHCLPVLAANFSFLRQVIHLPVVVSLFDWSITSRSVVVAVIAVVCLCHWLLYVDRRVRCACFVIKTWKESTETSIVFETRRSVEM
jgi:hypothetical protein